MENGHIFIDAYQESSHNRRINGGIYTHPIRVLFNLATYKIHEKSFRTNKSVMTSTKENLEKAHL